MMQRSALFFAISATILMACGGETLHPREAKVTTHPESAGRRVSTDEAAAPSQRVTIEPCAACDPRGVRAPRQKALLAVELQGLEALYQATHSDAPDRPAILRRLAEDYVELARAAPAQRDSAHRRAAAHYAMLLKDYPARPDRDEVFYFLGLEEEAIGELGDASKIFLKVIEDASPRFQAQAYFAVGEIFYAEGREDPSKLVLASTAYEKVLTFGRPDALMTEASARLAEIDGSSGG